MQNCRSGPTCWTRKTLNRLIHFIQNSEMYFTILAFESNKIENPGKNCIVLNRFFAVHVCRESVGLVKKGPNVLSLEAQITEARKTFSPPAPCELLSGMNGAQSLIKAQRAAQQNTATVFTKRVVQEA